MFTEAVEKLSEAIANLPYGIASLLNSSAMSRQPIRHPDAPSSGGHGGKIPLGMASSSFAGFNRAAMVAAKEMSAFGAAMGRVGSSMTAAASSLAASAKMARPPVPSAASVRASMASPLARSPAFTRPAVAPSIATVPRPHHPRTSSQAPALGLASMLGPAMAVPGRLGMAVAAMARVGRNGVMGALSPATRTAAGQFVGGMAGATILAPFRSQLGRAIPGLRDFGDSLGQLRSRIKLSGEAIRQSIRMPGTPRGPLAGLGRAASVAGGFVTRAVNASGLTAASAGLMGRGLGDKLQSLVNPRVLGVMSALGRRAMSGGPGSGIASAILGSGAAAFLRSKYGQGVAGASPLGSLFGKAASAFVANRGDWRATAAQFKHLMPTAASASKVGVQGINSAANWAFHRAATALNSKNVQAVIGRPAATQMAGKLGSAHAAFNAAPFQAKLSKNVASAIGGAFTKGSASFAGLFSPGVAGAINFARVGAMIGGGVVAPITAAYVLLRKTIDFAEHQNASNRRLAGYSPAIAMAFANQGLGDMNRAFRSAQLTEKSVVSLAGTVNGLRSSLVAWESAASNAKNIVASEGGAYVTALAKTFSFLPNAVNWAASKMPSKPLIATGAEFIEDMVAEGLRNAEMRRRRGAGEAEADIQKWAAQDRADAAKQRQAAGRGGLNENDFFDVALKKIAMTGAFLPPMPVRPPARPINAPGF